MPHLATVAVIGWKVLDRFRFGSRFAVSPHGLGIAIAELHDANGQFTCQRRVSADPS